MTKDTTKITIPDFPIWIVTRLRVLAAHKGERGYGKELIRTLEKALNEENKEEN